MGLRSTGYDEATTRRLVEPVYSNDGITILFAQQVNNVGDIGNVPVGDGEEVGGLVDDDEVVVFVEDLELHRLGYFSGCRKGSQSALSQDQGSQLRKGINHMIGWRLDKDAKAIGFTVTEDHLEYFTDLLAKYLKGI